MDSWFLVQTKPKQEIRALKNLQLQGLGAFCPLVQVEKLYAGRRRVSQEVLFPNYLFVQFDQTLFPAMADQSHQRSEQSGLLRRASHAGARSAYPAVATAF
jgi:transcription antitermination factor NusG